MAADRSCKEDWADQEFRARPSVRWADERPGRYSPDVRYSRVASPEHGTHTCQGSGKRKPIKEDGSV